MSILKTFEQVKKISLNDGTISHKFTIKELNKISFSHSIYFWSQCFHFWKTKQPLLNYDNQKKVLT